MNVIHEPESHGVADVVSPVFVEVLATDRVVVVLVVHHQHVLVIYNIDNHYRKIQVKLTVYKPITCALLEGMKMQSL